MEIVLAVTILYLIFKIADEIGYIFTTFIPPKGLWRLIPFRVSGWYSELTGRTYKLNWIWEEINFDEYTLRAV